MVDAERIAKLEIQVEGIKDDVKEVKEDIKELHSRITTGNREIMDKIDSMDSKIESKLLDQSNNSATQHAAIKEAIQADLKSISGRVDGLEKWRWMVVGGAAVVGFLFNLVLKLF